jgi:DNA-binding transcriptional LysR family regulator
MKLSGSDIHLLRIFDSVVRSGGFSAAQAELNLSQPTISNHITSLEQRLGVQLCQRGRRGFLITEKGQMVHETSLNLLAALDDYSVRFSDLKGKLVGKLRIATVDCISSDPNMKLPEALARFTERASAVELELMLEPPQDLQGKVFDGAVHVGIGSFENRIYGLEYEELYTEEHSLYCGRTHPLFETDESELTIDLISAFPTVHRGYWSKRLRREMKGESADTTVWQMEAQLLLVLSGRFFGLLPDHYAQSYVQSGMLRNILPQETLYECDFQMVTKQGRKTRVVSAFMEEIRSAFLG